MTTSSLRSILVANRGEIARRVFRTARHMGIRSVAVYSEPDRRSPHVRDADVAVPLGGATAAESYLDIGKIIDAARRAQADAIHPGYGFLAESSEFARACRDAGITWIGPSPEAIEAMALKIESKAIVTRAGVPTLPSAEVVGDDPAAWARSAEAVGYPLLVKASAGGGGKGMRTVTRPEELADAVTIGRSEAGASFGDPTVFLERLLVDARHVEVQVLGDEHGDAAHLFERDCSVQRRHQKVVEEARAPGLSPELATALQRAAVDAARAIRYVGAGTVEFMVAAEEFFFLEMNTRLQVEHPVTEELCGVDLVRLQLEVAAGASLRALAPDGFTATGHAVEARLYAEDPARDFMPSVGMLERFAPPDDAGIRWDNGVESGSEISPYYDSMLAKVIAHAPTRTEAVRRLAAALRRLEVHGLTTNRELLVATLEHPAFEAGRVDTGFYDAHPEVLAPKMPDGIRRVHAVGAALVLRDRRHRAGDDHAVVPAGWRNVAPATEREEFEIPASTLGRDAIAVSLVREPGFAASVDVRVDDEPVACAVVDVGDAHADVELDGLRAKCMVRSYGDRHYVNGMGWQSELVERDRFGAASVEGAEHGTMAPVPGTITEVAVTEGQWMQAGDLLVVLEAMKIQHRIVATADGVVEKVWVEVGDRVDAHQVLVDIGERSGEGEES